MEQGEDGGDDGVGEDCGAPVSMLADVRRGAERVGKVPWTCVRAPSPPVAPVDCNVRRAFTSCFVCRIYHH